MGREQQTLEILSDGGFHSSEALAAQTTSNRAAVRNIIHSLQMQGIAIEFVKGRGYRLEPAVELLSKDEICKELSAVAQSRLTNIEIYLHIDSTNSYLMRVAKSGLPSGAVCLAELQLAGRGRSNRPWVSPFASNLYLSLLWRFEIGAAQLSGISLAAGIAVVQALERLGVTDVGLKWPNDLLWQKRKLGGVLLEFGGNTNNACYVVTGIGLNVAMPAAAQIHIDQPWTDLNNILGSERIPRNRLAARVLEQIVTAYVDIEHKGLGSLTDLWRRYDLVANRKVILRLPSTTVIGIARGIDTTGALLLETEEGIQRFMAGEISLRFNQ